MLTKTRKVIILTGISGNLYFFFSSFLVLFGFCTASIYYLCKQKRQFKKISLSGLAAPSLVPSMLCSFSLEGEPTVCGAWSGRTKGETGTDKTTAGKTGRAINTSADVGGDRQWAQTRREVGRQGGLDQPGAKTRRCRHRYLVWVPCPGSQVG